MQRTPAASDSRGLLRPPLRVAAVAAALAVNACDQPTPTPAPTERGSAGLTVEVVATGLEFPWSIAVLPSGELLVTERAGRLRRIGADGTVSAPIAGVPAVFAEGQGGLFEVHLAEDFPASGRLFLSYAAGDERSNGLRIASARLDGDRLADVEVVFSAEPPKAGAHHFGGRLTVDGAGALVTATGEGFAYREAAQDPQSDLGKSFKITPTGVETFTLGHRNPQGLAYDVGRGVLWAHEHGPQGGDEINRLEAGANYGWPIATFGIDYTGARISPYETYPGMTDPVWTWTPSIAPSDLAVYRGALFSDWDGDLLVTALADRSLRVVDLDAAGAVLGEARYLGDREARLRAVTVAPDGALLIATDVPDGEIWRVTPAG